MEQVTPEPQQGGHKGSEIPTNSLKYLESSFPAQHTHTEADFTHSSEEAELLTGGSFQKYIWAEAENIWSDGILITER